jgi:exoribonuclease II
VTEQRHAVDDDVPEAGSTVSLLSVHRDVVALAELESWSASPSGLVVTSHVTTSPKMARLLDGQRTWASAYTQQTNTLVVFEGVARQSRPDQPGSLTLDGVSLIAREHRRAEPRAQVPCGLELRVDQASRGSARVIDLSRSGCRVELSEPGALAVGETAVAELALTDATVVRVSCQVLRLDDRRREAVLRFGDMTDTDAAALRRSVLAQLSASGGSPLSAGA